MFATSSRIWNTVICVEMTDRSRKAARRLTRTSDNFLICLSGPPPMLSNVRFPENSMFTKADEAVEDDVQNESLAYDWIKSQQVQTSCSMRVRIRACSDFGLMDFINKMSLSCAKSNAYWMAWSRVWTLSSFSYCFRSVYNQMNIA